MKRGHSRCWFSGALSNPLLAPESALKRLGGATLEQFVSENYTAPRMVLAASGVEHEELLSLAEPLLSDPLACHVLIIPNLCMLEGSIVMKPIQETPISFLLLRFLVGCKMRKRLSV